MPKYKSGKKYKKELDTESDINTPTGASGEYSAGGDNPDPESDDDTVKNAQDMGIGLGEGKEDNKPQEVDIGKDIDDSEEHIREH